jgi:hypothetical protein
MRIRDGKKFGSGIRYGKNSDPGSGMEKFGSGIIRVKMLKFFDVDPGWKKIRIRDPVWEKFGSGITSPDPQHCMMM